MKIPARLYLITLGLLSIILTGCIHEYPVGSGMDPTRIVAGIEISFELNWEEMMHHTGIIASRAGQDKTHRFIIEVRRNGEIVGRDYDYLSDEEFSEGMLRHRLSFPLSAKIFEVAVWYDKIGNNEGEFYNTDNLSNISLFASDTDKASSHHGAFGSEILDLRDYYGKAGTTVVKNINLNHAGARFELIATDIQEFIANNRGALFQGDSFTIHLNFEEGTTSSLDIYTGRASNNSLLSERKGALVLPFAQYDELKIAEGYLICQQEEKINMTLTVYNSAQMIVTKTSPFTIPVKRGMVTVVSGNFLTNPFDSPIKVDPIWEGEYIIEI